MGKFSMLLALGVLALLAVTRGTPQPSSNSSSKGLVTHRNNSGSDEAHVSPEQAMQPSLECVKTSVDLDGFMSDVETLSNETRGTFFPKYCPGLTRAGSCLDGMLKAAKPFLEKNDFNIAWSLKGIYPGLVNLTCKNDGEIIFKLAEPKYKECVENLKHNTMECTEKFVKECDSWYRFHMIDVPFGVFSSQKKCIERKLNVCQAPDIIPVFELFTQRLYPFDSCNNVRLFLDEVFVSVVQYMSHPNAINGFMSTVTENETNTVNEN